VGLGNARAISRLRLGNLAETDPSLIRSGFPFHLVVGRAPEKTMWLSSTRPALVVLAARLRNAVKRLCCFRQ
jgi:hypothetical protein